MTLNNHTDKVFEILSQESLEYIIGIDFGHGETTATYYDIHCNQGTPGASQYHELRFTNSSNEHKIVSAYYTDATTGKVHLVLNPETDFSRDNVEAYFKDKVSIMREKGKCDVMQRFARLVFEAIQNNNRFIHYDAESGARNFALFIACPSTWDDAEALEYLKLLQDGGVPADWVITESDAAYHKWTSTALSDNQNLLLIDIGSSTVDIVAKTSDGKISLPGKKSGAQRVEELLLPHMGIDQEVERAINAYYEGKSYRPDITTSCKLYTRKAKEDFYSYNQDTLDCAIRCTQFRVSSCGTKRLLDAQLDRDEVNRIISSYKTEIHQLFQDTLGHLGWTPNDPNNKVLLTGGASKMDFVKEYAKDIFGEICVVGNDIEPDFVVSQGVCIYAKKCMELAELVSSMEETPIEGIYRVKKKWEHPQSYSFFRSRYPFKYGLVQIQQSITLDILSIYKTFLPCDYSRITVIDRSNCILTSGVISQYYKDIKNIYNIDEYQGVYNILEHKFIIPCEYHTIYEPDKNGLSRVLKSFSVNPSENLKCGYIDFKTGEVIIPFIYNTKYSEWKGSCECDDAGLYCVQRPDDNKWGIIDKNNKTIVPFIYENEFHFYESSGYKALVKRNGLYGFVDLNGKEFISCKYVSAHAEYARIYQYFRAVVGIFEKGFFGNETYYEFVVDEKENAITDKYHKIEINSYSDPTIIICRRNGYSIPLSIITGQRLNFQYYD